MSERSEVVQKEVGFSWKVSIKKTVRVPKEGSRYDDVLEVEAGLGGHAETEEDAYQALWRARFRAKEAAALT